MVTANRPGDVTCGGCPSRTSTTQVVTVIDAVLNRLAARLLATITSRASQTEQMIRGSVPNSISRRRIPPADQMLPAHSEDSPDATANRRIAVSLAWSNDA